MIVQAFGETGFARWTSEIQTLAAKERYKNVVVQCLNPADPQSERVYSADGLYPTLQANSGGGQSRSAVLCYGVQQNASGEVRIADTAYTISTNGNATGRNAPLVFDARGNGNGKTCPTLTGDHENRITDYTSITLCVGNGQTNNCSLAEIANTLDTMHDQQAVLSVGSVPFPIPIVRRLTPLEAERLQAFPDGWTDIGEYVGTDGKRRKTSDTARYAALGNSIALPQWEWLAKRIVAEYDRHVTKASPQAPGFSRKEDTVGHTGIYAPGDCVSPQICGGSRRRENPPHLCVGSVKMGSLFDGIAGFPLVFQRAGATPVWASEISEFAIAVSRAHFPEEEKEVQRAEN